MQDVQPARKSTPWRSCSKKNFTTCRIYATDMNETVLRKAKAGIFPVGLMQDYTQHYLKQAASGLILPLTTMRFFPRSSRKNIVFSQHNLATDSSFNEFNVILCQKRPDLFQSIARNGFTAVVRELCMFGVLGLGYQGPSGSPSTRNT